MVEIRDRANVDNIFSLYNANDEVTYFWIRKHSWFQTIGYVLTIGGQDSGPLYKYGAVPYYSNPEVIVAYFSQNGEFKNISKQNSAGSWSWNQVIEPSWWDDEKEDLVFNKFKKFRGYESY